MPPKDSAKLTEARAMGQLLSLSRFIETVNFMKILDGKALSRKRIPILAEKVTEFRSKFGRTPVLTVVLVGEDPASQIYVGSKIKACAQIGIESRKLTLPSNATHDQVTKTIEEQNDDASVDGILLQLPLPKHLNEHVLTQTILASKDVDGLTEMSLGKLLAGQQIVASCTPAGVIELLKENGISLSGKHAVVVGRSLIVGLPMAQLLIQENATVTVCHSKTVDLAKHTKQAEVIVVAMGKPKALDQSYFSDGAVVVDVGIHRSEEGICGDVDFESVKTKVQAITPVPGGVGPMTISMLLENTIKLAWHRQQS